MQKQFDEQMIISNINIENLNKDFNLKLINTNNNYEEKIKNLE